MMELQKIPSFKTDDSSTATPPPHFDLSDGIADELEIVAKRYRAYRRAWIPAIKTILASASDIVGDWWFYIRMTQRGDGLEEYEMPLKFFCYVSSVLGIFTVFSLIFKNFHCCSESRRAKGCFGFITILLGFEIFFEDIPQMILTSLVLRAKNDGVWNSVAVFNMTTSAFNFTFNVLDMMMPLEEEHHDNLNAEKKAKAQGGYILAEKMICKNETI